MERERIFLDLDPVILTPFRPNTAEICELKEMARPHSEECRGNKEIGAGPKVKGQFLLKHYAKYKYLHKKIFKSKKESIWYKIKKKTRKTEQNDRLESHAAAPVKYRQLAG